MNNKTTIRPLYSKKFPKNFINNVNGWGSFSREIIEQNKGKLLTLDIDFGNVCSLNCPHCFRRSNKIDIGGGDALSYPEIKKIIRDAKKLGLRSVKFLGAGEPFQDRRFLDFLRFLHSLDIVPAIFTKGHVIGNDDLVKKYNSQYGITTGKQLVKELDRLNASILLGFNSFKPDVQDAMVGRVKGYTEIRNRALRLLVEAGFNKHNPTRLCIGANPVTNQNYDEVFKIYRWARLRNMYVIVCPTMVSGRCGDENSWRKITPTKQKLVDLYTKIYRFNLKKGIQTLDQIINDGIAPYAGAHPCNQVACGMYVMLNGTVVRCPGDDTTVFGNVREKPLQEIWQNSENYRRSGTFNCGCPPKMGKSIPSDLFSSVLKNLQN